MGLGQVTGAADIEFLEGLIRRHFEVAGSRRAWDILEHCDGALPLFWKVAPHLALTEEGPQTVVQRHLASLRAGAHSRRVSRQPSRTGGTEYDPSRLRFLS